jgi:signal transduction histidine kinase
LLAPHDAQALGLPATETIAAFAPVREGAHRRWSVAVLDPTSILRSQERAITLQVAAVGAILALALSILSAYLVLTARRVIAYQERLRAAEQLVRAEKLATVGVLAAGIAHEIGTPLAVVRGRAQRIAEKLGPEHAQTDGAATIVREIDRVSRTVRELLDYARPSAARTVTVSPASVARWVVELLEVEARSRQVSLGLDLAQALPDVAANPDQLEQVLVNVILNALDACSPGGQVLLRAREGDPRGLALEVEDDGAGIPDELRNRIFDPFFTTKKRGKGTGLGLTVVEQLVRSHGGRIEVASAVGQGTRVRILWPLAVSPREERHG